MIREWQPRSARLELVKHTTHPCPLRFTLDSIAPFIPSISGLSPAAPPTRRSPSAGLCVHASTSGRGSQTHRRRRRQHTTHWPDGAAIQNPPVEPPSPARSSIVPEATFAPQTSESPSSSPNHPAARPLNSNSNPNATFVPPLPARPRSNGTGDSDQPDRRPSGRCSRWTSGNSNRSKETINGGNRTRGSVHGEAGEGAWTDGRSHRQACSL